MSIPERICHFIMRKFISPEGAYHKDGNMMDLLTYAIGKIKDNQSCIKFITNLITFSRVRCMKLRGTCIETLITFLQRLVYELMLLSYCYIFVSICLMKCVARSDLDCNSNEMCA
jgi:hypothetical protein